MITTSYLANYRKFGNYTPVCIMRWKPHYFDGIYFPLLAPSSELLSNSKNNRISFDTFREGMIQQLKLLDSKNILNQLYQFGDDIVLLCSCKDYEHCHRKIVASWLSNREHIEIKEL